MIFTIRTLHKKGYSQRAISRELRISRKTVKKYIDKIKAEGVKVPKIKRQKVLDEFYDVIKSWYQQGLTGILIQEKLLKDKGLRVGYSTVSRYLKQFKTSEVYIPLLAKPAEEAQVDFGYLGKFTKDNKSVKVWCFSMVLSHSRYSYNCLVTDQSINSFINAHIKAFEYFGAVPKTVKIDNLKAGVITPNFYEPTIQIQYNDFLQFYHSAPITARVRRGQDKGKVEASIKYIKNNFLKRVDYSDFYRLENELLEWTTNVANKRLHGTTKKIPQEVFLATERDALLPLSNKRYEIYSIEQRKVNNYAHISFKNNFYSVPYILMGQNLIIKSNENILRIYKDTEQVAIHQISQKQGEFITKNEHLPPEKQRKTFEDYQQKAKEIGEFAVQFLEKSKQNDSRLWLQAFRGVLSLKKLYDCEIINLACKRAIDFKIYKYSTVKNICKNGLYEQNKEDLSISNNSGFSTDLKIYDELINNINLN